MPDLVCELNLPTDPTYDRFYSQILCATPKNLRLCSASLVYLCLPIYLKKLCPLHPSLASSPPVRPLSVIQVDPSTIILRSSVSPCGLLIRSDLTNQRMSRPPLNFSPKKRRNSIKGPMGIQLPLLLSPNYATMFLMTPKQSLTY